MTSTAPIMTTLLKSKTMSQFIKDTSKPPLITPGDFMLDMLYEFENVCYLYFSFKEISDAKQVAKIVGGLQDGCIQTWYYRLGPRLMRVASRLL
jgi:hypothetical protein